MTRPSCVSGVRRMNIAGLVLAAGGGSRFGRPKAGVTVGGSRLVDLAVGSCAGAGLSPVVVVLGAVWLTPRVTVTDLVSQEAGEGNSPEVRLLGNPDWASGLASSLRVGLDALGDDHGIDAVIITLVDTPSVRAEHLRRVGSALHGGAIAAVATYEGMTRTPVGLNRKVWADVVKSVEGDEGARRWLRAHPQLVTNVECSDLGSWTDIDTPADLPD